MKTLVIWCDFNKNIKHDEIISQLRKLDITVERYTDSEAALEAVKKNMANLHTVMVPLTKEKPKAQEEEEAKAKAAAEESEVIKLDLNTEQELEVNKAIN